jgi:hypothetical protein
MDVTWRYFKWRYFKLHTRIIQAICSKLYQDTDKDIRKSIMVAGAARSGTTWLGNIISSQIPCRIMFEPFHAKKVEAFRRFHYFQYMRPAEQNSELQSYCQKIFTGHIRHGWIDRKVEHLLPRHRLVKEIRANLFLKWIHTKFPEIPLLFIIRHPCAVVLSLMQLAWATDTDIASFLSQPKLIDDLLADKMDIIRRAQTAEEKYAIIWCISNLVPIKQFHSSELNVVFYENLCLRPEAEVPKIFRAIRHEYEASVFEQIEVPSSTTVRTSAVVTGSNKVALWKNELSSQQINNILSIVKRFELDYIYDDSVAPLVEAL